MPSQSISTRFQSLLPSRLLRQSDNDNTSTSVAGSSAAPQGPPPPYAPGKQKFDDRKPPADSLQVNSNDTSEKLTEPADGQTASNVPSATPSLQICPHQTLSSERMHRILNLKDFKGSRRSLDALIAVPGHEERYSRDFRRCNPLPQHDRWVLGHGEYTYIKRATDFGEGLVLTYIWNLNLTSLSDTQSQSLKALKAFLSKAEIQLCPHQDLAGDWTARALLIIMHPEKNDTDPIDQWEAGNSTGTSNLKCGRCTTKIKVSGSSKNFINIEVMRFLGKGFLKDDTTWMAQCQA